MVLWGVTRSDHVILAGSFHSVTHKGHGRAEVVEQRSGERYLRLVDFQTYPAENLEVCLSPLPDVENTESVRDAGRHCIGALSAKSPRFSLPSALDLKRFRTVVIWSSAASVTFTAAPLTVRE
jgi:hypothetical protein